MHPILLFTLLFLPGMIRASSPGTKMILNYPFLPQDRFSDNLMTELNGDMNGPSLIQVMGLKKDEPDQNFHISKSDGSKTDRGTIEDFSPFRGTIEYFSPNFVKKTGKYITNGYFDKKIDFKSDHRSEQTSERKNYDDIFGGRKFELVKPYEKKNYPYCRRTFIKVDMNRGTEFDKISKCPFFKSPLKTLNGEEIKNTDVCTFYKGFSTMPKNFKEKKIIICPLCHIPSTNQKKNGVIMLRKLRIYPNCKNTLIHSQLNGVRKQNNYPCCKRSRHFKPFYQHSHWPYCKCSLKSKNDEPFTEDNKMIKSFNNYTIVKSLEGSLGNGNIIKTLSFFKYESSNPKSSCEEKKQHDLKFDKSEIKNNYYFDRKSNINKLYSKDFRTFNINPVKTVNNIQIKESDLKPNMYWRSSRDNFKNSVFADATHNSKSKLLNKYLSEYERQKEKDIKTDKNDHIELTKQNNINIEFRPIYGKISANKISNLSHKDQTQETNITSLKKTPLSDHTTIVKENYIDVNTTPKISDRVLKPDNFQENNKITNKFNYIGPYSPTMAMSKTNNNTNGWNSLHRGIQNIIDYLKSKKASEFKRNNTSVKFYLKNQPNIIKKDQFNTMNNPEEKQHPFPKQNNSDLQSNKTMLNYSDNKTYGFTKPYIRNLLFGNSLKGENSDFIYKGSPLMDEAFSNNY